MKASAWARPGIIQAVFSKKQTVATYHEIDGGGDIVDMADRGLAPHEVKGGWVGRAPQVGKPSFAPRPVRDVSDTTHAGERPASSESSSTLSLI